MTKQFSTYVRLVGTNGYIIHRFPIYNKSLVGLQQDIEQIKESEEYAGNNFAVVCEEIELTQTWNTIEEALHYYESI